MKSDMGGAAAVAGAFRVLVEAKLPPPALFGHVFGRKRDRPHQLQTRRHLDPPLGASTVEINNTDAEGRLLLADGVSWAARVLKADTIIDAATLTGAQLIATGMMHAAVISNDEALRDPDGRGGPSQRRPGPPPPLRARAVQSRVQEPGRRHAQQRQEPQQRPDQLRRTVHLQPPGRRGREVVPTSISPAPRSATTEAPATASRASSRRPRSATFLKSSRPIRATTSPATAA
jgi:hypothetical protein